MRQPYDDAKGEICHLPGDAFLLTSSVLSHYPRCPRKCLRSRFSYDACVVILRCPSLRGFHLGSLFCHGFFCVRIWENPRWVSNVGLFCRGRYVFPTLCTRLRASHCHHKTLSIVSQLVCLAWRGDLRVSHCRCAPHNEVGSSH